MATGTKKDTPQLVVHVRDVSGWDQRTCKIPVSDYAHFLDFLVNDSSPNDPDPEVIEGELFERLGKLLNGKKRTFRLPLSLDWNKSSQQTLVVNIKTTTLLYWRFEP